MKVHRVAQITRSFILIHLGSKWRRLISLISESNKKKRPKIIFATLTVTQSKYVYVIGRIELSTWNNYLLDVEGFCAI